MLRLFQSVRRLKPADALHDAIAGLTLAALNIPQALGYTKIAGMPVVTGIYTLLLPLIGFAAFGSFRYLVVATDSATAAIFAGGGVRPRARRQRAIRGAGTSNRVAYGRVPAADAFAQTRLHRRFLSQTVLAGFLMGVGFQVGIAVLGEMLGIQISARRPILQLGQIFRRLPEVHLPTLVVSVVVVAVLLLFQRFAPKGPRALLAPQAIVGAHDSSQIHSIGGIKIRNQQADRLAYIPTYLFHVAAKRRYGV